MNPRATVRRAGLALAWLAASLGLAGCQALDNFAGGARIDYRSEASKTPSLEVPPDLTQLAREGRYRPQAGVVSASAVAAGTGAAAAPAAASVALNAVGNMRIERQGSHRWLVVPMSPEQLWPQLQSFWQANGFTVALENMAAGVMETNWAENRAKLPQDFIRRTIGRVFENAYDTGVRDLFRTRVERGANGTEVYILHRSVTEEFADQTRERTVWRAGPNDPQLEAEFLARLMVQLGAREESARAAAGTTPAAATAAATAPAPPLRADATSLELNEPFDRAWRRVGLALDRTGFTVEDRDRSAGVYFVRYVTPSASGAEEPGFFARIFGGKDAQAPVRYRVLVKAAGEGKTTVSVQSSQGAPETGDAAKRIIALVANDLR